MATVHSQGERMSRETSGEATEIIHEAEMMVAQAQEVSGG